jgi:iron(II)-dependent oxidoreductase
MVVRSLPSVDVVGAWVRDARRRTLELIDDLDDAQLFGPRLEIINPLLWEIGHVAWFQEKWALRRPGGRDSFRSDADTLYDSSRVPHATRWELPLPSRVETLRYAGRVEESVLERLARPMGPEEVYFLLLTVFHEDMHAEAFTYTRQTLGYPTPGRASAARAAQEAGPLPGDVEIAGGTYLLGAAPDEPFVFDNEKWGHPVKVRPFAIARAPVTQSQYAAFVDDGGYVDRRWWTGAGWLWRSQATAEQPAYWRREAGTWQRRHFDRWGPLEPHQPMIHVNAYEAEAYCQWAGRRLPTEAEWEAAACGCGAAKTRFPWGSGAPTPLYANLDGRALGPVDVAACAAGDSAAGCRQMIGNVWEWTADAFAPYPGFIPDPYREYSVPWFGTHRVLRGGAWPTRGRLLRNTWRNFYRPERRDVFAGFRTCAP